MEYGIAGLDEAGFKNLLNGNTPILVDFYATWCEPCTYLDEILGELEKRLDKRARIIKLDIDEQGELARSFHIMSVPTLMLFKDGELKWRMAGFKLVHELEEDIKKFM